ncbi:hypothetical protein GCM10011397_07320 [Wenyingzhuangia marina]|nr:hypothetical protein GCM10011397_07320 [Wenyingzhuangia marina]
MKRKHCPCCNSTLRFRRQKKNIYKLFFFVKMYTCSNCDTLYAWIKGLDKSVCIKSGSTEKVTKTTS